MTKGNTIQIPRRCTCAEIDLEAFRWNYKQICDQVKPAKIAAVVKADAYGHGCAEIAREALKLGAEYLCVAFVQEGLLLRESGITCPVMVLMQPIAGEIRPAVENDLELMAFSYESAKEIAETARKTDKDALLQIDIDTGMHTTGILWENAVDVLTKIHKISGIKIKGIYTHFASADWADLSFAREQLRRFNSVLENLPFVVDYIHAANTGAILQMKDAYFNMVRPGISLYGYYPSLLCRHSIYLKPVMTLKSYVALVKKYKKGERFSYSLTYTAEKDTEMALIPAGYADGVNRLLSNTGFVLIRGKKYPVAGVVTMDSILVDIGLESGIRNGDEVVLLGRQGTAEVSINDWCEKIRTIPYEVTCNISARVPRVYINRT